MDLGRKIKQLRFANDLTLEELANHSELSKGFLSQVERNLTSPSVATLDDILEALGTNLHDFFDQQEDEQLVFGKKDFFMNEQDDYRKNRNYWKYLKNKLKKDNPELVSVTNQLKLIAPDSKKRAT